MTTRMVIALHMREISDNEGWWGGVWWRTTGTQASRSPSRLMRLAALWNRDSSSAPLVLVPRHAVRENRVDW